MDTLDFSVTVSASNLSRLNFTNGLVNSHVSAIYASAPSSEASSWQLDHLTVVRWGEWHRFGTGFSRWVVEYSNCVDSNTTTSVLYGTRYGMTVRHCIFCGPETVTLFDCGNTGTNRRFRVSNCEFAHGIRNPARVSSASCQTNARAATWAICFWEMVICPGRCFSEAPAASRSLDMTALRRSLRRFQTHFSADSSKATFSVPFSHTATRPVSLTLGASLLVDDSSRVGSHRLPDTFGFPANVFRSLSVFGLSRGAG
jgi:hypothetical protein